MSDDSLKLTRRLFLRHSAAASAVSMGALGIALKTDAVSQARVVETFGKSSKDLGDAGPYPYFEPRP